MLRLDIFLVCLLMTSPIQAEDRFAKAKTRLWADVDRQVSQLGINLGFEQLSPQVRQALTEVPRHEFVPQSERSRAYINRPLPIGYGQTISQPLIVAVMTELLKVKRGDRVFELGTGSGYQAAVLDAIGAEVYSMEIIPELGKRAGESLARTGHKSVQTRVGDGYLGWEEAGPFDAIIVTAAGDHIPPPLIRQLKPGGRMVLPVGGRYLTQQLVLVTRDAEGRVSTRELMAVSFVPLTGSH
jgi:protein-L-isoaspartate(D-aspartate) O-methyltransferase